MSLGLRKDILSQSLAEPRAHLEGANLPVGFKLPSLDLVHEDILARRSHHLLSAFCGTQTPYF